MMIALDSEGVRVGAQKGLVGYCPGCSGELTPKCGNIVPHHWAHKPESRCSFDNGKMSEWHIRWQNEFDEDWREVIFNNGGKLNRADIYTPAGVVIEFQHSSISTEKIMEREAVYEKLIWVFDARDYWGQMKLYSVLLDLKEYTEDWSILNQYKGVYGIRKWHGRKKTHDYITKQLVYDTGDSLFVIAYGCSLDENVYCKKVSREEFIEEVKSSSGYVFHEYLETAKGIPSLKNKFIAERERIRNESLQIEQEEKFRKEKEIKAESERRNRELYETFKVSREIRKKEEELRIIERNQFKQEEELRLRREIAETIRREISRAITHPVRLLSSPNWSKSISSLENFFSTAKVPATPIKMDACTTIVDYPLFIDSHLAIVKANNGKRIFLPYLERIEKLKQIILQT
jgi:hypothetical protein